MSERALASYILPSARGCYVAAMSTDNAIGRRALLGLLDHAESPTVADVVADSWAGLAAPRAHAAIMRMHRAGLIALIERPRRCPQGPLETVLPNALAPLSDQSRAVLADQSGLPICAHGVEVEAATRVAALSAAILDAATRHAAVMRDDLGWRLGAWGALDMQGRAGFGIWPLHLGGQRTALVLAGQPRFETPAFVDLVWALSRRYGAAD
jgi:hypothetical protein